MKVFWLTQYILKIIIGFQNISYHLAHGFPLRQQTKKANKTNSLASKHLYAIITIKVKIG